MSRDAQRLLGYGQFYGSVEQRREVDGLAFAVLSPDPGRIVERHTHEDAHFVLLLEGLYLTTAAGAPAVCSGATLVYNPPGTTHRDRFERRHGRIEGRFLTLSVSAARMQRITDRVPLLESATHLSQSDGMGMAQRIARECGSWETTSSLVTEGLALELLEHVARRNAGEERAPPAWLRVARELLRDRCAEDVSIAAIAHATGVHPVHLARTFRRFFGCTPGDYLRESRLERGAALLRETRRSLSEVALSSGFADQSHFSKAFRRRFGIAPGGYRRSVAGRD